jgi:uncharacterized protein
MSKILITGGSGLIGKKISELLLKLGQEPVWLSREGNTQGKIKSHQWDIQKRTVDEKAFEGVEQIVHLAGAGIADKRWTDAYKQNIIDSRVKSSELLLEHITKKNIKIKTLVGGSAIGYYGAKQSDKVVNENESPGNDFLAESCVLWEKSYLPFSNLGIRVPMIRTGVVLSRDGGAYPRMAMPFKMGLGAALGSGKQFFPWIHINDVANIFVHALLHETMDGIYNAVSSEYVTNKDFSKQLAKSLHKVFFLPNVPAFVLRLAMGENALMVTEGLKTDNTKIKKTGFVFEFETLDAALKDLAG